MQPTATRALTAGALAAVLAVPGAALAAPSRPGVPRTTAVLESVDVAGADPVPGWTMDDGWVGGWVDGPVDVASSATDLPAAVAATVRRGDRFSYTLRRLEPGVSYTLRLHLLEHQATSAGENLMNVDVNGTRALTDLDVYAAAGGRGIPVRRDVAFTADADGRATLLLTASKGEATLAALQVVGRTPATRLGSYEKVTGVRAVATGPRTAHVSWRSLPGIAEYAVLRDGKIVGRTAADAYVDNGATAGAQHRYAVAAVDPDGTLGIIGAAVRVRMPSATPRATGRFHTEGSLVIDPAGKPFVPVGANVGSRFTFDWAGPTRGHSADAKEWGWNAIRVVVDPKWWDEVDLRALITEYRAAGLVVVIDAHSYWVPTDPAAAEKRAQVRRMWEKLVPEWSHDSGVWFNVANEPGYVNDDWVEFNAELLDLVRGAGAQNIVVVDAPTWGQDLGSYWSWWPGARHGFDATMAPSLAARYSNVILGQHNYGARYTTPELYGAYVDKVHAQGLPLVANEFGYTTDGSSTAGTYEQNRSGAKAVFAVNPQKGVGTFPWIATQGHAYSLKQDWSVFYSGGAGAKLSEMGRDLWALTH